MYHASASCAAAPAVGPVQGLGKYESWLSMFLPRTQNKVLAWIKSMSRIGREIPQMMQRKIETSVSMGPKEKSVGEISFEIVGLTQDLLQVWYIKIDIDR